MSNFPEFPKNVLGHDRRLYKISFAKQLVKDGLNDCFKTLESKINYFEKIRKKSAAEGLNNIAIRQPWKILHEIYVLDKEITRQLTVFFWTLLSDKKTFYKTGSFLIFNSLATYFLRFKTFHPQKIESSVIKRSISTWILTRQPSCWHSKID